MPTTSEFTYNLAAIDTANSSPPSQQPPQPRVDLPSDPLPIDLTIFSRSVDPRGPPNSKSLNNDEIGHNTSSLDSSQHTLCVVVGCKEMVAPAMWSHHMSGHLRGVYQGEIPVAWLKERKLHICNHCSSFVASSRWASHQQKCSAASRS